MEKSDKHKQTGVQMYLFGKEEWTNDVPVLDSQAVSLAKQSQVDEYSTGRTKELALPTALMERIASLANLVKALKRVISNKGSAGIDGMSVEELRNWFSSNWKTLQRELLEGSYEVSGVRGVSIPKPSGGERQLGIPTAKDRLIQQAIHQVLSDYYDPSFSTTSYGFIKGRNAHQAVLQLSKYIESGLTHVVDIDLAKFFDEVNHERLLHRLRKRIGDKRVLGLIHQYLRAGLLQAGLVSQRLKGTPQGSPLSPLLSNIVLDELDKELSRRGHRYVRYADDLIIVVGSERAAHRVKESVSRYIEERMKLKVNSKKSKTCRPLSLNYLGYRFKNNGEILLSVESEKRLKNKIRVITKRNRGRSLSSIIDELNISLRGWIQYFSLARMKSKLVGVDSWLRRRLRCYRLKQCKRAIGIVRFLQKLGVPVQRAWTSAASRKGWWRKSSTPAANEGMNLSWFNAQGLLNLSAYYQKVHC